MRIGLLDVDGHAKKKKWGATIYPNLALGKIARYHKMQGDQVEWAEPFGLFNTEPYDIIYASKVFNFSEDVQWDDYKAHKIVKGGTGYDIHSNLPNHIDHLQPDYSMFPNLPSDTAYGFLTRGCPNKCNWCVVPKKEGGVVKYMDIEDIAIDGRKKVVLMDNNILAMKEFAIQQMEKSIRLGLHIDFNQAMDARLVDRDIAEVMSKVKWIDRRIRFGCDTTPQIKHCENAIQMIEECGFRGEFFLYTMLQGSIDECYSRLHHWWKNLKVNGCTKYKNNIYPHSQPFRDTITPNTLPQWQIDMARWTNHIATFKSTDFYEYSPRINFKCSTYFNQTTK